MVVANDCSPNIYISRLAVVIATGGNTAPEVVAAARVLLGAHEGDQITHGKWITFQPKVPGASIQPPPSVLYRSKSPLDA